MAGGAVEHVDLGQAAVAGVDGAGGRVGGDRMTRGPARSAPRYGSRWFLALQRLTLTTDKTLGAPHVHHVRRAGPRDQRERIRERVVSGALVRRGLLVREPLPAAGREPCRCTSWC